MDTMKASLERKLTVSKSKGVEAGSNMMMLMLRKTKSLHDPMRKNTREVEATSNIKSCNRFLIIVEVFGSTGPIKFLVNKDDDTRTVIDKALKHYAREGRLPVLGSNTDDFHLYPVDAGFDALKSSEQINNCGARKFLLCKKQQRETPRMTEEARSKTMFTVPGKGSNKWRLWLPKALSLRIISY